ncbi:hypothetical protein AB0E08_21875 [Streptomyces sp. NPDC048281]|uniref:WD40 repeat domain-containing protein n=1 Tax=Streptomyces sp. NPDC048281 TaxID=3154715 RepID=UPI00344787A9
MGLSFDADGTTLAALAGQGAVRLRDLTAGGMPRQPAPQGAVHLRDMTTGTVRRTLGGPEGPVIAMAFGGPRLATVGSDGTVRIWEALTGEVLTKMRTDTPLRCRVRAPDGRALFAGGPGGLFGLTYRAGAIGP